MSLGAQNGFVYDGIEEKVLNGIFTTLDDAGVICCIAAGNEGSMADGESITAEHDQAARRDVRQGLSVRNAVQGVF